MTKECVQQTVKLVQEAYYGVMFEDDQEILSLKSSPNRRMIRTRNSNLYVSKDGSIGTTSLEKVSLEGTSLRNSTFQHDGVTS